MIIAANVTDERAPIPARFQRRCELCSGILDNRVEGVHQWTSGWVKQREGGGGHGISLPQRVDRWAHLQCVEREVSGLARQSGFSF
jgi:hypothetical protein